MTYRTTAHGDSRHPGGAAIVDARRAPSVRSVLRFGVGPQDVVEVASPRRSPLAHATATGGRHNAVRPERPVRRASATAGAGQVGQRRGEFVGRGGRRRPARFAGDRRRARPGRPGPSMLTSTLRWAVPSTPVASPSASTVADSAARLAGQHGEVGRYRQHRQRTDRVRGRRPRRAGGRPRATRRVRRATRRAGRQRPPLAPTAPGRVRWRSEHRRHDLRVGPPAVLDQREHPFVLEHRPRRDTWRQRSRAAGGHTGRGSSAGGGSGAGGSRGTNAARRTALPRRPRRACARPGSAPASATRSAIGPPVAGGSRRSVPSRATVTSSSQWSIVAVRRPIGSISVMPPATNDGSARGPMSIDAVAVAGSSAARRRSASTRR